jgi:tetratricopeptide (TPR) repeat protein
VIGGWDENPQASLERAQASARRALALDDRLAEVHFVSAFVALFRRDHETAIRELERALALRSSYADAHALLAYVLYFAGRPEQARAALERAIRLNPRVPSAYLMIRSEFDITQRRYHDAIAALETALEMNSAHPRMHLLLAAAYAHAGRVDDARWTIEQLLVLHPAASLARLHDTFPFRDPAQLEHVLDGLRRAGLPE